MKFKRIFWPIVRVTYFVSVIIDIAVLSVFLFPPEDGNVVRAIGAAVLINVITLVSAWGFIPWPRPELERTLKPKKSEPSHEIDTKNGLELYGQQSIDDFLKSRRSEHRSTEKRGLP